MGLCHAVTSSIHQLRNKVSEEHDILKKKEMESGPKASHGYGGRFGVERDRMDKVSWKGDICLKKKKIDWFICWFYGLKFVQKYNIYLAFKIECPHTICIIFFPDLNT